MIADKKMENVKTEENIIGTIRFLEKLLEITTEDISARVERLTSFRKSMFFRKVK